MGKGGSIKPGDRLDPRHDLVEDPGDGRPSGRLARAVHKGQVSGIFGFDHLGIMQLRGSGG
jgi:hypothetical protein